ncbi:MAG TPA: hypothetical protein VF438_01915 [Candidatus Paceibacterota bacterium]
MKKSHIIAALIVIVLIVVVVIGMAHKTATAPNVVEKDGMKTYIEKDFGFSVTFPSDWIFEDKLTGETCCLFVAHWVTSTTTAPNASGTPVTSVTQQEIIKLQIGAYDKRIQDIFGTSSRPVTMDGKTFYTGRTPTGEYFLLPRDENTGIGAAEFGYEGTPQSEVDIAHKVVSSLTFIGKPTAQLAAPKQQSTATSTSAATTTKK